MFKVSQEMRLNTQAVGPASNPSGSGIDGNSPEEGGIFGRYQRTPDAGEIEEVNIEMAIYTRLILTFQMPIPRSRHGFMWRPN